MTNTVNLSRSFNTCLIDLISIFEKECVDYQDLNVFKRLRGRMALAIQYDPTTLIDNTADAILPYGDKIVERNESFFLDCGKDEINKHKFGPENAFVQELFKIISTSYKAANSTKKNIIYEKVLILYHYCLQYLYEKV